MAESLPLLRIDERRLERALRNSEGLRCDANASAIKHRKGNLIALAFFADAVFRGDFAICE